MTSVSNADILAHDAIARHIAAPHAAILFDPACSEVLFANQEGLKLIGASDLGDVRQHRKMPAAAVMRQIISAASSLNHPGESTGAAIRSRSTFRTRLLQVTLSRIALAGGAGLLMVSEAVQGRSFDRAAARIRAFDIIGSDNPMLAFVDGNGTILARNPHKDANLDAKRISSALSGDDATGLRAVETDRGEFLILAAPQQQEQPTVQPPTGDPSSNSVVDAAPQDETASKAVAPMVGGFSSRRTGPANGAGRWYYKQSALEPQKPAEPIPADSAPEEQAATTPPETAVAAPLSDEARDQRDVGVSPETPTEQASTADENAADATFAFSQDTKSVRFVWEMDAWTAFTSVSSEFAKTVGPENAAIEGLTWGETCQRYGLDTGDTIADLLKQQETWSGRTVLWPVQDTDLRVPVDLAGLPNYDRERQFSGFNGFGIIRMADVMIDDRPQAEEDFSDQDETHSDGPEQEDGNGTLVAGAGMAVAAAAATVFAPGRKPTLEEKATDSEQKARQLSNEEQETFAEIGEKLASKQEHPAEDAQPVLTVESPGEEMAGKAAAAEDPPSRPVEAEESASAANFIPSAFAPKPRKVQDGNVDTSILARLPIPVLVYRDEDLLFANDEFHSLTGYRSLAQLAAMGGVDALFAQDGGERIGAAIIDVDGQPLPVQANLQMVPWDSRRAMLLTLRDDPFDGEEAAQSDAPKDASAPQVQKGSGAGSGARSLAVVSGGGGSLASAAASPRHELSVYSNDQPRAETLQDFADLKSEDLRSILDTATDGVIVIGPDAAIRAMNGSAEALFDVDAREMKGRPFVSLIAPESRGATHRHFERLSGSPVDSLMHDGIQITGQTARGGLVPLFMTVGRTSNADLRCAVLRDVTPWQKTEKELVAARQVAEDASAEKSDFLARISHEVRTPLNAIIGFSDIMIDERYGPIENDRYRGYLRDIQRSGSHILDLINDLLDISRIEAGKMDLEFEPCDLNRIAAETVALSQPQANREQVIIRTSLSAAVPLVMADARSLRQIILNLVTNSIKFTRPGGQVIVSTVYDQNGEVALRVRDTGIGMDDAQIEAALRPFSQVATLPGRKREGSGLGLPLTKATVEANHARFHIESEPEAGTLVEVHFPAESVRLRD